MVLRKGDKGPAVAGMQRDLEGVGFDVGIVDGVFGPATELALRAFQRAAGALVGIGLDDDGVFGPKSQAALRAAVFDADDASVTDGNVDTFEEACGLAAGLPDCPRDAALSDLLRTLKTCSNGEGCRYGGWIDPYVLDRMTPETGFVLPEVDRFVPGLAATRPAWGGTCGPFWSWTLAWWLGFNADYTFRVNRDIGWMLSVPFAGAVKPGSGRVRGYADWLKPVLPRQPATVPLGNLYRFWSSLGRVNTLSMDHHIVGILKVGGPDGLRLADPTDPSKPMEPGLVRFGADGHYDEVGDQVFYSGTRLTVRRVRPADMAGQGWRVHAVAEIPEDGVLDFGPTAGRERWPVVLSRAS